MQIRASLAFTVAIAALGIATAALAGPDAPPVEKISPAAAAQRMKDGSAVVVDVRERRARRWRGRGRALVSDVVDRGRSEGVPEVHLVAARGSDDRVLLRGRRARGSAAEIARKELGRKTANLGGFKDWKSAGLPVKTPAKKLEPGDPAS